MAPISIEFAGPDRSARSVGLVPHLELNRHLRRIDLFDRADGFVCRCALVRLQHQKEGLTTSNRRLRQ